MHISHQVERVHRALDLLVFVLQTQDSPEVRDVRGGESQSVQLTELGVGRHPGQRSLEAAEGAAQHPHARPLAGVGGVALLRTLPAVVVVALLLG